MNFILLKKLKRALKTSNPLESIKEIVNEFDELSRLAKWKQKTLEKGTNLKRHRPELDRVSELLEKNGFYCYTNEEMLDEIRSYYEKFK